MAGNILWRLHLGVPPEDVYAALDSAEARAVFWAESAPEVDGSIRFTFPDGTPHDARILERTPPVRWAIEYFGAPAVFELHPDLEGEPGQGGTDLILTHSASDFDDWIETHAGWLNVLLPLKAWVVHGVDLRNHDSKRTWRERYADQ